MAASPPATSVPGLSNWSTCALNAPSGLMEPSACRPAVSPPRFSSWRATMLALPAEDMAWLLMTVAAAFKPSAPPAATVPSLSMSRPLCTDRLVASGLARASKRVGGGWAPPGQPGGDATKDAGTSLGVEWEALANLPTVVAASGNSSSTTQSAISGGTIIIRDEEGQRALTGKTAAEMIAALNRDTSDTLNTLKPIFDKEKIEAGFEIVSEASRQTGQFLTNRAKEADALKKAMDDETDPALKKDLKARYEEAAKWGPDGSYRIGLTAISAAAGGNVTGSAGQFLQSAAANYLQALKQAR